MSETRDVKIVTINGEEFRSLLAPDERLKGIQGYDGLMNLVRGAIKAVGEMEMDMDATVIKASVDASVSNKTLNEALRGLGLKIREEVEEAGLN